MLGKSSFAEYEILYEDYKIKNDDNDDFQKLNNDSENFNSNEIEDNFEQQDGI